MEKTISDQLIENTIKDVLKLIGENPDREGLLETPERVRRSFQKLFEGYLKKAEDVLKTDFKEFGAYDGIVILKDIDFYSTCEHHILPFFGKVHLGYIPDKKVVGVSKIARLIDIHARRLQIQERMTADIAADFNRVVQPTGIGIVIEAQHFCMKARGVERQNSMMVTSTMLGKFREDLNVRQEFLQLIKEN